MMQDVATAKSDIAAFATGLSVNSSQKSESNEQFGQLLQDQSAQQSLPQTVKKNTKQDTSVTNAPLPDKSKEVASIEKHKTQSITPTDVNQPVETKDVKNTVRGMSNADASLKQVAAESPTKQGKALSKSHELALQVEQELTLAKESNKDLLLPDVDLNKHMAELKLELPENPSSEKVKAGAPLEHDVVAEEWLALVESYQKLADIAQTTKRQTSQEQTVNLELEKELPKDIDKNLLKPLAEEQIIYHKDNQSTPIVAHVVESLIVDADDFNFQDPKLINLDVINPQVADLVGIGKGSSNVRQTELSQSNVASLVQKALDKLSITTEAGEVSSEKRPHQTAELLLTDPQLLTNLQQEIAALSTEIENGEEVGKQQLAANTELLQSLITDNAAPANKLDAKVVLDTAATEPVALAKDKELEVETTRSDINSPELASATIMADEFQLEADLTQITQPLMASVAVKNTAEDAKKASDISLLMALPDKKLIKVLEHIASQIIPSSSTADVMPSEQSVSQLAQQLAVAKSPEVAVAIDNQTKELISAFKSGIEEFKQQLAQGREPGIDLKSLITDAMAKSNDAAISKANVNVQQISQSISQVLEMAQSINRAIEQHQEQAYSAVQRDVAQIQGEQSKSLQFNHLEAKFEKAVNITKPDGHQQLAEKVRWMVNTKNLVADIRLDPAELGSVHVKVAMSGESATVNFVVQSQHARDAMDNATPKLREMLAEKGIELGQSSVEQENKEQSSQGEGQLSQHGSQNHQPDAELELTDQVIAQQPIVNGALGGIDYFV